MANTNSSKSAINPDTDVHITFEDQQKINIFARHNAKIQDVKEEMENKKKQLQAFQDAADELLIVDEDNKIPFMIGEIFFIKTLDETTKTLEESKTQISKEVEELTVQRDEIKQIMSDLKVQLYAKFGNNINLEAEEE